MPDTSASQAADIRLPCPPYPFSIREQALLDAMKAIVTETMDWPVIDPINDDSSLPAELTKAATAALAAYGAWPFKLGEFSCVLCVNCAYIIDAKSSHPRCAAPQASINLVDGYRGTNCLSERENGGFCGPRGRAFVAAPAEVAP